MQKVYGAVIVLTAVLLTYGCRLTPLARGPIPSRAQGIELQGLLADLRTQRFISFDTLVTDVATAQVIAVGEEHNHAAIQAFELHLLQALTAQRPRRLALGMEFIERDMQTTVEAYLAGTIGRTEFQERLEASPSFMELYFPLVRHARQHSLPVVPLNAPRHIARRVAQHGLRETLAGLSRTDRAYLPAFLAPITPRYRAYFLEAVAPHHPLTGRQAEHFVEASHLKDDTMAQALAAFLEQHPDFTVLAIAGRFHFDYGIAIPTLLQQHKQRITIQRITTMAVAAEDALDLQRLARKNLAHYVRFFPPAPGRADTAAAPTATAMQP